MPPRPTDPPGAEPKQHRISTGLAYPGQASESLQLAEQLGNALECHRLGLEPFNWTSWLPKGRQRKQPQQAEQPDGISGRQAVRLIHQWWGKQRHRGPSAEDSWKVDYDAPLAPLLDISPLLPEHLWWPWRRPPQVLRQLLAAARISGRGHGCPSFQLVRWAGVPTAATCQGLQRRPQPDPA